MDLSAPPDLTALGATVRARRRELGLTQEQLAGRLGWSQERVSILENGKYGMPSLPLLSLVARALELPLSRVMAAVGFPPDEEEETGSDVQASLFYTLRRLLALESLTLKDALNEASDLVARAMAADKVDAFLYEEESDSLVALGTSNTDMGQHERQVGLDRLPLANGGRQVQVFRTGEPFYTGHAGDDPEVVRGLVNALGVQSMVAVPLWVDGVIRGILVADSAQPDHFSPIERAFFSSVARWVGVVAHRIEMQELITRQAIGAARHRLAEEMLTTVAHDLGNGLTPVKGRIDLLLRHAQRTGDEHMTAEIGAISQAMGRLDSMVRDLLAASRLEGGLFSVVRTPLDLVPLLRSVVADLQGERSDLVVRVPPSLHVEGDAARLHQALRNLVGNALQHTETGVPVLVTAGLERRADGPWAVIDIHDEGPGIPSDLLPALFSRHAVAGEQAGLGLGLFLARGIATAHGGSLTVTSENGTTFTLAIPALERGPFAP